MAKAGKDGLRPNSPLKAKSRKARLRRQNAQALNRGRFRVQLDEAFRKPGADGDALIDAIVKGAKKGDSALIKLAAEYRWGKPKQEIDVRNHYENKPLEELLELLPKCLDTLREAGLSDFAFALKTNEPAKLQSPTSTAERPSIPYQDVAAELPEK